MATEPKEPRSKVGRPRDPDLEVRRRAQILDVAAQVFSEYGFANTLVQTIANRVGVGNGTVYRYFPTKEKLFLAAVERGLDELTAEMDRVLALPLEPLATLTEAVRAYLSFFHRRREMAELFIQERAAFRHHHRPLYFANKEDDEQACKHREFFTRLMETGRIRPIPLDRFFDVMGDLLYGTILTNLLSGRTADPDEQTHDVVDVILHGILTDTERQRQAERK